MYNGENMAGGETYGPDIGSEIFDGIARGLDELAQYDSGANLLNLVEIERNRRGKPITIICSSEFHRRYSDVKTRTGLEPLASFYQDIQARLDLFQQEPTKVLNVPEPIPRRMTDIEISEFLADAKDIEPEY